MHAIKIQNKLDLRTMFSFESSRNDIMQPRANGVHFEARESKLIDLYFASSPRVGATQVYLYASDSQQDQAECHLLRIAYLEWWADELLTDIHDKSQTKKQTINNSNHLNFLIS